MEGQAKDTCPFLPPLPRGQARDGIGREGGKGRVARLLLLLSFLPSRFPVRRVGGDGGVRPVSILLFIDGS